MEQVARINWKDSKFEKDEIYEQINAPQWFDLLSPTPFLHDDDAFFCRSDCNHPKTADDFFIKTTPNHSKHQRSANLCKIPSMNERNQSPFSSSTVKKRGTPLNKITKTTKHLQDSENQNPNFVTPTDHVKSSTEKKQADRTSLLSEGTPRRLRSTFSARNLFAGNNILNQITEFCNELKRLATRKKERMNEPEESESVHTKREAVGVLQEFEIQKKPLLEATKVKLEVIDTNSNNGKEKLTRRKKNDVLVESSSPFAENTKSTRAKGKERVIQTTKSNPLKALRPRPPEEAYGRR